MVAKRGIERNAYERGTTTATNLDTRLDLDHLQDRANTEVQMETARIAPVLTPLATSERWVAGTRRSTFVSTPLFLDVLDFFTIISSRSIAHHGKPGHLNAHMTTLFGP